MAFAEAFQEIFRLQIFIARLGYVFASVLYKHSLRNLIFVQTIQTPPSVLSETHIPQTHRNAERLREPLHRRDPSSPALRAGETHEIRRRLHLPPRPRHIHTRPHRPTRPTRRRPPRRPRHNRLHAHLALRRTLPPPRRRRLSPPGNHLRRRPSPRANLRRPEALKAPLARHLRNPTSARHRPL